MSEFEARRVLEHIDKLAYEIGPRLSGTRGDRLAADYVKKQFESYGLKTSFREFKFVDRSIRTKVTAGLFLTSFIILFFLNPHFSLMVWLLTLVVWRFLPKILPKRKTQNIIGVLKPQNSKKRLAVTAHIDSARCIVNYNLNVFVRLTFIPLLLVSTIFVFARLFCPVVACTIVWLLLACVFLPVCVGMFVSASVKNISIGADDNASGVSVMLEVARVVAEQPPHDTELMFIAFGAEEQGLVGSRKMVANKELPKDIVVLNLDMVGVGTQSYFVEGNGMIRKVRTPSKLNQILVRCGRQSGLRLKPWWAALAGHDHIPLCRAKIQATTLTFDMKATKNRLSSFIAGTFKLSNVHFHRTRHIHTVEDTPEKIKLENIEGAGKIVLGFIETMHTENV